METTPDSTLHNCTTDDLEFMMAFKRAIQDPDKRKQIISFLETNGLLPFAARLPA